MISNFRNSWGIILVSLLVACSSFNKPPEDLGDMSRKDFMNAMRWQRFQVAASLMQPEYREDFMETFKELKDLHIVDVRLIDLNTLVEGRRFETSIEMDYYLLPSVSVKTFRFDQTWVFFDAEDSNVKGFFIVTPFPDFP